MDDIKNMGNYWKCLYIQKKIKIDANRHINIWSEV